MGVTLVVSADWERSGHHRCTPANWPRPGHLGRGAARYTPLLVGLMLIVVFDQSGWLPTSGMATVAAPRGLGPGRGRRRHLVLPAITLSLFYGAGTRLMRARARAVRRRLRGHRPRQGLTERRITFAHVLRNAILRW
jgi:ABC-type dipeptide/oligopeptide/nickel transport system permease component